MHRDDLAFSKFCFLTFLWKFSFIVSISRCPLQPPHNLGDGSETEICCKILWKSCHLLERLRSCTDPVINVYVLCVLQMKEISLK